MDDIRSIQDDLEGRKRYDWVTFFIDIFSQLVLQLFFKIIAAGTPPPTPRKNYNPELQGTFYRSKKVALTAENEQIKISSKSGKNRLNFV